MFDFIVVFSISVTLQVLHKHVPCRTREQSLFLTAVENTWIHGRQKRRERMRQLRELPRAPPCAGTGPHTSEIAAVPTVTHSQEDGVEDKPPSEPAGRGASCQDPGEGVTQTPGGEQKDISENEAEVEAASSLSTQAALEAEPERAPASAAGQPTKPAQSPSAVKHFLFKCLLNVMEEEGDVVVEMHWVEGQNKDLMNQLCTFLKNTLLKSIGKS